MSLPVSPAQIVEESRLPLLQVPPTWKRRPLGEVAQIVNGFAFKSAAFVANGGKPLIRIRDIFNDETEVGYVGDYEERYLVRPDDLLVGMDGDFRCARWRGSEALLNQRVCKVVPDAKLLNMEFLTHVLPAYLQAIHDATSSTTVTHLSSRDIALIPIPVPPLTDQEHLAELFRTAVAKEESSTKHIEAARRAIQVFGDAVLASATSGRLTAEWRDQHQPEPMAVTSSSGPVPRLVETPSEWTWCRLSDIAEIKGGVQKGAKLDPNEPMREVPYLRVANVQRGWLDLSEMKNIVATERRITELRLQPGDVLFNEGGDRDKLGRGWVWDGQIEECIHQNHVFRARLRNSAMQPRFYSWFGNTIGAAYFEAGGKQTVNLASLNMSTLKALPVPVPSPQEQAEIVRRVTALLGLAASVEAKIESAARLAERSSRAVLAAAFRGELVLSDSAKVA